MSASLRFAPMPLAVLGEPFDHDGLIFDLKYDGFRALAHVDSGGCRLISRNCREFTTHEFAENLPLDLENSALVWRECRIKMDATEAVYAGVQAGLGGGRTGCW